MRNSHQRSGDQEGQTHKDYEYSPVSASVSQTANGSDTLQETQFFTVATGIDQHHHRHRYQDSEMTEKGSRLFQYLSSGAGNICAIAAAVAMGWSSPILPMLKQNPITADNPLGRPINEEEGSWIGSLIAMGGAIGGCTAGFLAEKFGRKNALLLSTVPALIGWILIATANNLAQIYVARILFGISTGIPYTVLPMYIGEIAETSIRGALGSLMQVFITLGLLYSYIIGPYVTYTVLWIASICVPIVFFVSFVTMPESPYYLLSKGRKEDAIKSVSRLRGKSANSVQKEVDEMQVSVSPPGQSAYPGCREAIRIAYARQHLSEESINILIASLTDSTIRQYNSGLKRWWQFCENTHLDPFQPTANTVVSFLTERFQADASYGTLNSERSAIALISSSDFSNNPIVSRFFKGLFKLRPTKPKYNSIWNTETVLKWAETLEPVESLDLKLLTYKLVILLALGTAHRVQTLSLIKINNITTLSDGVEIRVTDPIKTTKVGSSLPQFFLPFFKERKAVCVAKTILAYLALTKDLRKDIRNLFITMKKPYCAASTQTLSRWIKTCLMQAGLDKRFTAHSTRHAAVSTAELKGIDIGIIKSTAGWSEQSQVFARFYKRPIESDPGIFVSRLLRDK